MDQYQKTRDAVRSVIDNTVDVIGQAEAILGDSTAALDQWKNTCQNIQQILADHVIRIAVVGAIKSGKSTLVNAMLQDDYLKRGAGVVTSIVTRIRRGEKLRAHLFFKSWDEVNAEIEQALVLFPSHELTTEHDHFDIRRRSDRTNLEKALSALDADLHLVKDGLNANSVLLSSYLKGFDTVEDMVSADAATRDFGADRFGDHRQFVGEDRLAVYLKDIQLDITNDTLDTNLEMADCQGSDSPNPLHMAMVQDYLLKAHLIVYVISSRTGLRQADIRFLSIIKQMGIADHILFVCNFDINEHDSLEDLRSLVDKMAEELAMLLPEPRLFVFSALYHLFVASEQALIAKDRSRLQQWRSSENMVAHSGEERERFKRELDGKLTRDRSALLLHNQMEHLGMVVTALGNWVRLNRRLLQKDTDDTRSLSDRLQSHQGSMRQVQSMIRGTLDGGIQTISKELKNKIDGFFDPHGGPLLDNVIGFIRNYQVDLNRSGEHAVAAGFTQALYRVYQEFKQALNTHMAEKVNPEIVGFMGRQEDRLVEYLHSVVEPYEAMVSDAVGQFEETMAQLDLRQMVGRRSFDALPDLAGVKQSIGLALPPAAAIMRYSAHIKTDAVLHLGAYSLMRLVRKLLKKPTDRIGTEERRALKDGIRRMKRETERSIYAHFKDYRENIKFQYMLRLVNAASARLFEGLTEHFSVYVTDLNALVASMGSERSDKEKIDQALQTVEASIDRLVQDLDALRRDVAQLHGAGDRNAAPAADGTTGR